MEQRGQSERVMKILNGRWQFKTFERRPRLAGGKSGDTLDREVSPSTVAFFPVGVKPTNAPV
jgi:hypothetical protein